VIAKATDQFFLPIDGNNNHSIFMQALVYFVWVDSRRVGVVLFWQSMTIGVLSVKGFRSSANQRMCSQSPSSTFIYDN
jgi:hypothetical protein